MLKLFLFFEWNKMTREIVDCFLLRLYLFRLAIRAWAYSDFGP